MDERRSARARQDGVVMGAIDCPMKQCTRYLEPGHCSVSVVANVKVVCKAAYS